MDANDDLIDKHQSDQIDRGLKDKYRDLNLWAEIGAMRGSDPDEDRQNQISYHLLTAEAMLKEATEEKRSFAAVEVYVTDKILPLDSRNARALMIRAIANSQLYLFVDAARDAEAAISIEPDDDSRMGQYIRNELPFWKEEAERYGI
jgi:hypothetical protein